MGEYESINNINNILLDINPLLENIILESYDISYKNNNNNLNSIIKCVSNNEFSDMDGLNCKDYLNKDICFNKDLVSKNSELKNILIKKGVNKLLRYQNVVVVEEV